MLLFSASDDSQQRSEVTSDEPTSVSAGGTKRKLAQDEVNNIYKCLYLYIQCVYNMRIYNVIVEYYVS